MSNTQKTLLERWTTQLERVRQEIVSGICNSDELAYLEKEEIALENSIEELEQQIGVSSSLRE
jgi:vacuolar-type H+-ATPase subunit E/Vma4